MTKPLTPWQLEALRTQDAAAWRHADIELLLDHIDALTADLDATQAHAETAERHAREERALRDNALSNLTDEWNRAEQAQAERDKALAYNLAKQRDEFRERARRAEAERDRYRAAWQSARRGRKAWREQYGDTANARMRVQLHDMTVRAKAWMRLYQKAEVEAKRWEGQAYDASERSNDLAFRSEQANIAADRAEAERDALAAKLARVEAVLADPEWRWWNAQALATRIRAALADDTEEPTDG